MKPPKALRDRINLLKSKRPAPTLTATETAQKRQEAFQDAYAQLTGEAWPDGSDIFKLLNPAKQTAEAANNRDSDAWQTRYSSATEQSTSTNNAFKDKPQQRATKADEALAKQPAHGSEILKKLNKVTLSRWSESTTRSIEDNSARTHQNAAEKIPATPHNRDIALRQTRYSPSTVESLSGKHKPLPPLPSVSEPAPSHTFAMRVTRTPVVEVSRADEVQQRLKQTYWELTGADIKGGEILGMLNRTEKSVAEVSGTDPAPKLGVQVTRLKDRIVTNNASQGLEHPAQRNRQDRSRDRSGR